MVSLAVAAILAAPRAQADSSLSFSDGIFTAQDAGVTDVVRTGERPPLMPTAVTRQTWRLPDATIQFDADGLRIDKDGKAARSTLSSVATSTTLFTDAQIAENKRLAQQGVRSLEVSGVNGSAVIGSKLILWLRWEDKGGIPWLEGLFEIDSAAATPASSFIGKMPGDGFKTGLINDRLRRDGEVLFAPVKAQRGWGIGSYNITSKETGFTAIAEKASDAFFVPGSEAVAAIDKTTYGTTVVHLVHGTTVSTVAEIRGPLIGFQDPSLVIFKQGNTTVLTHAETGAKMALPSGAGYRLCRAGLVLWTPLNKPTQGWLYDENFRLVARWPAN